MADSLKYITTKALFRFRQLHQELWTSLLNHINNFVNPSEIELQSMENIVEMTAFMNQLQVAAI